MSLRLPLKLHPDTKCAVKTIEVEVARLGPKRLDLTFFVQGGAKHIELHGARKLELQRDELWKSTCFELFLKPEGQQGYFEANMAPNGQWIVFRFTGYREGREEVAGAEVRGAYNGGKRRDLFDRYTSDERWADGQREGYVRMTVDLERAHDLPTDQPWHLGLSAIIEEHSGRKSYWALAHPPGQPDFHDPACFALELPAARTP